MNAICIPQDNGLLCQSAVYACWRTNMTYAERIHKFRDKAHTMLRAGFKHEHRAYNNLARHAIRMLRFHRKYAK